MRIRASSAASGKQERVPASVGPHRRDSLPPVPGNPVLRLQSSHGNHAVLRMLDRAAAPDVQRRGCSCDGAAGGGCTGCAAEPPLLQRRESTETATGQSAVAGVVDSVLRSPGQPLDASVRSELEPRFGYDLGAVRIHTDPQAAASARVVNALAYTVGRDIVFASGQHAPQTSAGRHLLAHELAHVVQQSHGSAAIPTASNGVAPAGGFHEHQADAVADAALAGGRLSALAPAAPTIQRRAAPYIKKVKVHLAPPQNAELEWEGMPPPEATGTDAFTVSTGKGYGDPGDPPGTCTRSCCKDADTQCAPPWNRPGKIGACCTYIGSSFWTGTPQVEHNGWSWWTPIQPFYGIRGIALHQHTEVTGNPIGHGCVRMADANAKRIFDYSNGKKTNVTIDGRAAPVDCKQDRQCDAPAEGGGAERERADGGTRMAETSAAVPGLEGLMT